MKTRIFLCISIILISFQIYAQYSSKTDQLLSNWKNNNSAFKKNSIQSNNENVKYKFYLGIISSIDYCYFSFNNPYSVLISKEESHGFHFGLKCQYNINENLSLRYGLSYSIYYYDIIYQNNGLDSLNFASSYHKGAYTGREFHKFRFWNLPLMFGYTVFTNKKINISPSTGLILRMDQTNVDLKTYAQINLGFEYFITKEFFFTIEPYFNYNLNIKMIDHFTSEDSKLGYGVLFSANFHL